MIKENKNNYDIDKFKSGSIAIVGAPNVGKSTLMNSFIGEKISITSNKPQTTRDRIVGVLNKPLFQFVFIDTPGIYKSSTVFNNRIFNTALSTITDVDLVLFIIDASDYKLVLEQKLIDKIKLSKKPIILIINKIDKIDKFQLIKVINIWSKIDQFKTIVPVSALTGYQIELLINLIKNYISEGPKIFPSNKITNMSEKFIVSEIIREKVFRLNGQEIPYSVAITIDSFQKKVKSAFHIHATIHVERDSQKGIIIGKNGIKLSQIGQKSRLEIQKMIGKKIFLKLFVRIQKNWSTDTKALKRFGY